MTVWGLPVFPLFLIAASKATCIAHEEVLRSICQKVPECKIGGMLFTVECPWLAGGPNILESKASPGRRVEKHPAVYLNPTVPFYLPMEILFKSQHQSSRTIMIYRHKTVHFISCQSPILILGYIMKYLTGAAEGVTQMNV